MDLLAAKDMTAVCGGCRHEAIVLHIVDGAKLCAICAEKSARIDRLLINVSADDPVACDSCADPVDFDARLAIVARECEGQVLCDGCQLARTS